MSMGSRRGGLTEHQYAVEGFHRAMGQPIGDPTAPEMPDEDQRALRARLIAEEAAETLAALGFDVELSVWRPGDFNYETGNVATLSYDAKLDLVELADGIADTEYVLLGTAVVAGIDTGAVFDEVHRSNMAKASGPVREDGKRLKPAGWQPPDVAGVLAAQGRAT